MKRYEHAVSLLDEAASLSPADARIHCRRGLALLFGERWPEALEAFGRALAIAPGNEWAMRGSAQVLLELGRVDEAVEVALRVVRVEPESCLAWGTLATTHARAENIDLGREAAAKAIALCPREPLVHVAAGRVALAAGDWKELERHSRAALALNPTVCTALHHLATALLEQDRPGEALQCFSVAISNCPTCRNARDNMESAIRLRGRPHHRK